VITVSSYTYCAHCSLEPKYTKSIPTVDGKSHGIGIFAVDLLWIYRKRAPPVTVSVYLP